MVALQAGRLRSRRVLVVLCSRSQVLTALAVRLVGRRLCLHARVVWCSRKRIQDVSVVLRHGQLPYLLVLAEVLKAAQLLCRDTTLLSREHVIPPQLKLAVATVAAAHPVTCAAPTLQHRTKNTAAHLHKQQ